MSQATRPALQPQSSDPFCGTCSTELCTHGLCRTCGGCDECEREAVIREALGTGPGVGRASLPDTAELPPAKLPICQIRLSATKVSRNQRDLGERIHYLLQTGIEWTDIADASRAIDERKHDGCGCGQWKRPGDAFCGDCFRMLGSGLRIKLKLHLSAGYLCHIRQAWKQVEGRWRQCALDSKRASSAQ